MDPQEDQLLAGLRPDDAGFGEDPPERWGRIYRSDGSVKAVPTDRGDYRWFYEGFRDAIRASATARSIPSTRSAGFASSKRPRLRPRPGRSSPCRRPKDGATAASVSGSRSGAST